MKIFALLAVSMAFFFAACKRPPAAPSPTPSQTTPTPAPSNLPFRPSGPPLPTPASPTPEPTGKTTDQLKVEQLFREAN